MEQNLSWSMPKDWRALCHIQYFLSSYYVRDSVCGTWRQQRLRMSLDVSIYDDRLRGEGSGRPKPWSSSCLHINILQTKTLETLIDKDLLQLLSCVVVVVVADRSSRTPLSPGLAWCDLRNQDGYMSWFIYTMCVICKYIYICEHRHTYINLDLYI